MTPPGFFPELMSTIPLSCLSVCQTSTFQTVKYTRLVDLWYSSGAIVFARLSVSSRQTSQFLYRLPPGCLSHRKEELLPELFPQTPVSGYSWPRRTQVAHKGVSPSCSGLPCRLVHSRGVHSVTRFVHMLSLNHAMCPAHPRIPFLTTSMVSFTPV